jgi:hypothetical protein
MSRLHGWDALASELEAVFRRGVGENLDEDLFTGLALRVFKHQYRACSTYRAFCQARSRTPTDVHRWQDVPLVPTRGFKDVELLSADEAEAVFVTSGTSRGTEVRGRHFVPRLSLYRASALTSFEAHVLPEGRAATMLSLIPSTRAQPHSSLSTMMGMVADELVDDAVWMGEGERGPDPEMLEAAARRLSTETRPILLVGTAFAFVHLLDALSARGSSLRLPESTRIMETGGFKGRSRSVSRQELYGALGERLGVPPTRIVNEYGMTELLSQLYEPVLTEGGEGRGWHVSPPWLRVRALDPSTLVPVEPGAPGLLAFFDLANGGSVAHVLTEDVGVVAGQRVRLEGRSPGAEPRGCSLVAEELLLAAEGST